MVVYLYLNSVLYNAVDKPGLKITYLDKKGEKMLTRRKKSPKPTNTDREQETLLPAHVQHLFSLKQGTAEVWITAKCQR